MDLRSLLSIEHPVLQAGMGGGVATAELAVAVSNAGGLGTLGFAPPQRFERDIERTRSLLQGKPYAVNLLMPFVHRAHVQACLRHKVPVVTLFYGFDAAVVRALKDAGTCVIYQVGTELEAERVLAAGADALIVQGFEAGGHVRGSERLEALLPRMRERFRSVPVIASGGVWDGDSAAWARALGADGVSCGTRFLMTDESGAHAVYKSRLTEADVTVVTTLFGAGWPAPHRVLVNQALSRWCDGSGQPRRSIRAFNWLSGWGAKATPLELVESLTRRQRPGLPIYSPQPLVAGMDARLIEVTPVYAGECVSHIDTIWPAARVVDELARGFRP